MDRESSKKDYIRKNGNWVCTHCHFEYNSFSQLISSLTCVAFSESFAVFLWNNLACRLVSCGIHLPTCQGTSWQLALAKVHPGNPLPHDLGSAGSLVVWCSQVQLEIYDDLWQPTVHGECKLTNQNPKSHSWTLLRNTSQLPWMEGIAIYNWSHSNETWSKGRSWFHAFVMHYLDHL